MSFHRHNDPGRPFAGPLRILIAVFAAGALLPLEVAAQTGFSVASFMAPSTVSSQMYFAHLADGAGWATSLFFSNPSQYNAATVNVNFYNDDGSALPLDFGSGLVSTLSLTVPAGGVQVVTSKGAGTSAANGWAHASSNIPLLGTLMYRNTSGGKPLWDVAALATSPTYYYSSYATPQIGVALANPSSTNTIHLSITALDSNGSAAGSATLTLSPLAHTSFNLGQEISTLSSGFTGTVTIITTDSSVEPFLAFTLNVRDGLLAPLPPGEVQSPAPIDRLVADAAAQVKSSFTLWLPLAVAYGDFSDQVTATNFLKVVKNLTVTLSSESSLKLTYQYANGDLQIAVSRLLAETLGGSKPALAFLLAHYCIRAAIAAYGNPSAVFKADDAAASDLYALVTLMMANLDPSGMVDFYGRMQLATGLAAGGAGLAIDSALQTEFLLNSTYTTRIAAVWTDLVQKGCGKASTSGKVTCQTIHDLWHPSYPALIP